MLIINSSKIEIDSLVNSVLSSSRSLKKNFSKLCLFKNNNTLLNNIVQRYFFFIYEAFDFVGLSYGLLRINQKDEIAMRGFRGGFEDDF